jgi:3-isopropylmalate dehydrogenase
MSKSKKKVLVIPGDGIGPEVVGPAIELMQVAASAAQMQIEIVDGMMGGCAIDATGSPLPASTLSVAKTCDAVLLGAVGGPKWDALPMAQRPERGLLALRSGLELFANLRPALLFEALADASSLKSELVAGLDILIVRELTGGIYFGEPRGIETVNGLRRGFNTDVYDEAEIARIGRVAFNLARQRDRRVCSVDKANVLEVTQLWRDVMKEVAADFPDVELTHLYVDNAAMQLVRRPKQFDVVVTGNMFGDILSDIAAMLTGSLGMLPSASLGTDGRGLYEPVHGSAPDIAGRGIANPLATMLSVGMMFRYSFDQAGVAARIDRAVEHVLDGGLRTPDVMSEAKGLRSVGTTEMANAVLAAFAAGANG